MQTLRVYAPMTDEFRLDLDSDAPLSDVICKWLNDRYSPISVVQGVRECVGLSLHDAFVVVRSQVNGSARDQMDSVWSEARQALGATPTETLSAFIDPQTSREVSGREMDVEDAFGALAIEQVRSLPRGDATEWVRTELERIGPAARARAQVAFLVYATDALDCPEDLVPAMLMLARWADASACRWPLAVVRRCHGNKPIEDALDTMRGGDADDRSKAGQWDYWQRVD